MVLWLSYVLKPNIVTVRAEAVVEIESISKTHSMRQGIFTYIQIGGTNLEQIMRFFGYCSFVFETVSITQANNRVPNNDSAI